MVRKILTSHELPHALLPYHDLFNDYPYGLSHLMSDSRYRSAYATLLPQNEHSILDNSAFELGSSIDLKLYTDLISTLKPSIVVLPDKLHDSTHTIEMSSEFMRMNPGGVILMGVLQGRTFDEVYECMRFYLRSGVTFIGIPYHILDEDPSISRVCVLKILAEKNLINGIRFHLLGLHQPSELLLYKLFEPRVMSAIISIDTSHPVLYGLEEKKYTATGFAIKPSYKLADSMDKYVSSDITMEKINAIKHNIQFIKSALSWA